MFHVVLFEPEIAPNTGAIIRLCANTGAHLHLIEPLGFTMDEKKLRRAGLDYHEYIKLKTHMDFDAFLKETSVNNLYLCTTKASRTYSHVNFEKNDALIFGPETRGLPDEILNAYPHENKIKIPMQPTGRSLNLAMAVGIISYEAWRQQEFTIIEES